MRFQRLDRVVPSLALLAVVSTSSVFGADVPGLIAYQGRVQTEGSNISGLTEFKFALVDAGGTTTQWSNDGTSVDGGEPQAAVTLSVQNGLFSLMLGDVTLSNMTAITPAVVAGGPVQLRVWVRLPGQQSFTSLSNLPLGASPYALRAATVQPGAIGAAELAAAPPTAGQVLSWDGTGLAWTSAQTGPAGPAGATGAPGATGINGATWTTGAGSPTGSAASGDLYLDTESGAVWQYSGSTWSPQISTLRGQAGKTILSGNRPPIGSDGGEGDFWLNTATATLYGPRSEGTWPNGISLIGPAIGAAGGDLTGNYPNPVVATLGGKSVSEAATANTIALRTDTGALRQTASFVKVYPITISTANQAVTVPANASALALTVASGSAEVTLPTLSGSEAGRRLDIYTDRPSLVTLSTSTGVRLNGFLADQSHDIASVRIATGSYGATGVFDGSNWWFDMVAVTARPTVKMIPSDFYDAGAIYANSQEFFAVSALAVLPPTAYSSLSDSDQVQVRFVIDPASTASFGTDFTLYEVRSSSSYTAFHSATVNGSGTILVKDHSEDTFHELLLTASLSDPDYPILKFALLADAGPADPIEYVKIRAIPEAGDPTYYADSSLATIAIKPDIPSVGVSAYYTNLYASPYEDVTLTVSLNVNSRCTRATTVSARLNYGSIDSPAVYGTDFTVESSDAAVTFLPDATGITINGIPVNPTLRGYSSTSFNIKVPAGSFSEPSKSILLELAPSTGHKTDVEGESVEISIYEGGGA